MKSLIGSDKKRLTTGGKETEMEQLQVSVQKIEKLREQLPILRQDDSLEGRLEYYDAMWMVTDLQHNMYNRLMLMGDQDSRDVAAEMQKVAEGYMDKPRGVSMETFFSTLKDDIQHQIKVLTCLNDPNTFD